MVLRVDESKLYSAAYRSRILDELTATLMEDERIAGAVLVGSGAAGFKDRYSDIDLTVLVMDEAKVDVYYGEAENLDVKLGMDRAPRLRAAMAEYLSLFSLV